MPAHMHLLRKDRRDLTLVGRVDLQLRHPAEDVICVPCRQRHGPTVIALESAAFISACRSL
jgi:hypothetical protein